MDSSTISQLDICIKKSHPRYVTFLEVLDPCIVLHAYTTELWEYGYRWLMKFVSHLVGGDWLPSIWHFPINIGLLSSSQLTNSNLFQRGGPPTTNQSWSSKICSSGSRGEHAEFRPDSSDWKGIPELHDLFSHKHLAFYLFRSGRTSSDLYMYIILYIYIYMINDLSYIIYT